MREKFTRDTSLIGTRSVNNLRDRAWGVEKDINNANRAEELEKLAEGALREGDEVARANNLIAGQRRIEADVGKGYLSAADGVRHKRVFSERYSEASLEAMPAERRLELIAARREGATGTPADFVPAHRLDEVERKAVRQVSAKRAAEEKELGEQYERGIIEFRRGSNGIYPRETLEQDPRLSSGRRNSLLVQYDAANKEEGSYQSVLTRLNTGGAFNRYDPNDQKGINRVYDRVSKDIGPEAATDWIVRKSYLVPDQVTMQLRSDVTSNEPEKVQRALEASSRMMAFHRGIFDNEKGEKQIEKDAVTYEYLQEKLGWSKERAVAEVIRQRDPDVKRKLLQDRKEVDIAKEVREATSLSDIASSRKHGFKNNWFFDENIDPRVRADILDAYQASTSDYFRKGKDIGEAKEHALQDLSKRWGPSSVNGKEEITHLPPEKKFPGIPNVSDRIAEQAIERINLGRGETVDRSKIVLTPIPGITRRDFDDPKKLPQYQLSYWDKNGHLQIDNKPFIPNPQRMAGGQISKAVQGSQVDLTKRATEEDPRRPYGVP
jgi:hypothetical protein